MLAEVLCDQKTKDKLGEDGLADVTASLWPRDCQTCSRKLGPDPPALCIDVVSAWAVASLHHRRCRSPFWKDGSAIFMTGGAHTSWTSVSFLLPARKADPSPVVLVNPALEMVFLYPSAAGWRPGYAQQFVDLGMVRPGRRLKVDQPLPGLSAWAADDLVCVTITTPPEAIYEASAPREVAGRARKLRGVMFMVTHALDPAELDATPDQATRRLMELLQSDRVLYGWAALSADRQSGRQPFRRKHL